MVVDEMTVLTGVDWVVRCFFSNDAHHHNLWAPAPGDHLKAGQGRGTIPLSSIHGSGLKI